MEARMLSKFVIELQWERSAVALAIFLDSKSGLSTDLTKEYEATDAAIQRIEWKEFGQEKIFENKLRFQIRIDDFR